MTGSGGRRRRAGALALAVAAGVAMPAAVTSPPACAATEYAVVVRGPDGIDRGACLPLSPTIDDAVDVLRTTGARVVTRAYGGRLGTAVCKIDGVGNDVGDCPGVSGHWHYWRWIDGRWVESEIGPSGVQPRAGGADAWIWTEGAAVAPRTAGPSEICALPALGSAGSGRATGTARGTEEGVNSGLVFASAAAVAGAVGAVAAHRRRRT